MTEIAINQCPRGYLLSEAGIAEFMRRKDLAEWPIEIDPSDPVLVQMLKEDQPYRQWAGKCSHVRIVKVRDDLKWTIGSVRGREWVAAHA